MTILMEDKMMINHQLWGQTYSYSCYLPQWQKYGVTTYGYIMKIAMKSIYITQNGYEQNLYTHDTFL